MNIVFWGRRKSVYLCLAKIENRLKRTPQPVSGQTPNQLTYDNLMTLDGSSLFFYSHTVLPCENHNYFEMSINLLILHDFSAFLDYICVSGRLCFCFSNICSPYTAAYSFAVNCTCNVIPNASAILTIISKDGL